MPYASIIIPTHDRHDTLPLSIESALSQTVEDIEVLVVGDGCTAQVREVAEAYAGRDRRVTFLDRPKAPCRGAVNRDHAVRAAKAERIFYNDDDDLLLPHHVAVLGPALDHADLVDTPAVSWHPSGSISLGLHDSGDPVFRGLLADHGVKQIFDTHLAHRKAAYEAGAGGWNVTAGSEAVAEMLRSFAQDGRLTWTTLDRITAVSFHGAARKGMTGRERRNELQAAWDGASGGLSEPELLKRGRRAFYAVRWFSAFRAHCPEVADDVAARLKRRYSDPADIETIDAARAYVNADKPGDGLAALLDELLDARLGSSLPVLQVLKRMRKAAGRKGLDAALQSLPPRPIVRLARTARNVAMATDEELTAVVDGAGPGEGAFFRWVLYQALRSASDPRAPAVRDMTAKELPMSRHSASFFRLVERHAIEDGLEGLAAEARRMTERLDAAET